MALLPSTDKWAGDPVNGKGEGERDRESGTTGLM